MKGIWKYDHLLPVVDDSCKIVLGEGNTPLVKAKNIGAALGLKNLYFKLENINPSGSYKDRFAACAIAGLIQNGAKICFATSSGNTGAALAAYSAAAGIKCFLAIVDGAPLGKLQQMQAYGAQTLMIRDFGKDYAVTNEVMERLTAIASAYNSIVQISAYTYSPMGMKGIQTIAYELAEYLPAENKHIFSPAGGGGLTMSLIEGFNNWTKQNSSFNYPKINCVQPEGNNTISGPLKNGSVKAESIVKSLTKISGLQVPNVLDGNEVIAGCRASGGTGYLVPDELVYDCQHMLAVKEGIFCEPAGAVALAGLTMALKNNTIPVNDHVICLVTGSGFKDPDSAKKMAERSGSRYFDTVDETFQFIKSGI